MARRLPFEEGSWLLLPLLANRIVVGWSAGEDGDRLPIQLVQMGHCIKSDPSGPVGLLGTRASGS
jgi:hypothetical protein